MNKSIKTELANLSMDLRDKPDIADTFERMRKVGNSIVKDYVATEKYHMQSELKWMRHLEKQSRIKDELDLDDGEEYHDW